MPDSRGKKIEDGGIVPPFLGKGVNDAKRFRYDLLRFLPAEFTRQRVPFIDFFDRVRKFADRFPSKVDEYEGLLTGNPIWVMRTKGVAHISAEDAIAMGASGPTLRGDFRRPTKRTPPMSPCSCRDQLPGRPLTPMRVTALVSSFT